MSQGTPPPRDQGGAGEASDAETVLRPIPHDPYALHAPRGPQMPPPARGTGSGSRTTKIPLIALGVAVVVAVVVGGIALVIRPRSTPQASPSAIAQTADAAVPPVTPMVETTTTVTATPPGTQTGWPVGSATTAEPLAGLATMPARTYRDDRFGFSLPVPVNMRITTSADKTEWQWGAASLSAWGENAPKTRQAAKADLTRIGADVTFDQGSDSSFVISGYLGDRIFYQKVLSGSGSSNWLYWEYPRQDKESLDAAVTRAALGFSPGDLASPH